MTFYRRNLPHWHPDGKAIFLTWRLYGSLPRGFLRGTAIPGCAERDTKKRTGMSARATAQDWDTRFRMVDAQLDRASSGPHWLADPEIADYAEHAILRGAELRRFELSA